MEVDETLLLKDNGYYILVPVRLNVHLPTVM